MKKTLFICLLFSLIGCAASKPQTQTTEFKNPVFNTELKPISRGLHTVRLYPTKVDDIHYPFNNQDCELIEDNDSHIILKCSFLINSQNGEPPRFYYSKYISRGIDPVLPYCKCEVVEMSTNRLEDLFPIDGKINFSGLSFFCSTSKNCGQTEEFKY